MSELKVIRLATVPNIAGLHMRPATMIGNLTSEFNARVILRKDHRCVTATDVLQVLTLGAGPGDKLELIGEGPDAQAAVDALVALIEGGFQDGQPK